MSQSQQGISTTPDEILEPRERLPDYQGHKLYMRKVRYGDYPYWEIDVYTPGWWKTTPAWIDLYRANILTKEVAIEKTHTAIARGSPM